MKPKKIPLRMCLGCQQMKPKQELMRVVKNKDNEISVDFTGKKPGRGAYLCKDASCIEKAKKTKRLERTYESKVDEEVYAEIEKQLEIMNDK